MKLGEKIRYLREVEGVLRGYRRDMTQQEILAAIKKEIGASISQSYLSQIENGQRPHLTNATRMLLARFFRVHPGYLVDDPEGYHAELLSDLRAIEDKVDLWLINGAERFAKDAELSHALLAAARHEDTRMCLLLLGAILETPNLAERLLHVLKPDALESNVRRPPVFRPEHLRQDDHDGGNTPTTSSKPNRRGRARHDMGNGANRRHNA
jgi:transcriptional regulator with XRE-family HTH domain